MLSFRAKGWRWKNREVYSTYSERFLRRSPSRGRKLPIMTQGNFVKRSIYLVGAGALGIRHLEGLLKVRTPLRITVVDRSEDALTRARAAAEHTGAHTVEFAAETPIGDADLSIIATTSRHRADAVRTLLSRSNVAALLLEKILFTQEDEYAEIGALLEKKNIPAWVNCPLRLMPLRREMREVVSEKSFSLHFQGGVQHGLMTNIIHYADYACYLAGNSDFSVDTSLLAPRMMESKRSGYKEMTGTIVLTFPNGTRTMCTSLQHERGRRTILSGPQIRAVFEEPKGVAMLSRPENDWRWSEEPAPIVFQSAMTGPLIEEILATGRCGLPMYNESAKVHLNILTSIRSFLETHGHVSDVDFPFT